MRLRFLIIFFLIFIIATPIITTQKYQVKVDNLVYEKLKEEGKVKVVIHLNLNKEEKENFIKNLENLKFRLVYKAKTFNAVSGFITKKSLEKLKRYSGIERINLEPDVKLSLQNTTRIVNATRVWDLQINNVNITGKNQTICIIDSGVNYSHPDLGGCYGNNNESSNCKIIGGHAFYNPVGGNESDPMDDNGHGTHVAGIIASKGSIIGIAPDAKIVALKACGPTSDCSWTAIIDSINWCVDNSSKFNITVISMSLGTISLYSNYCDNVDIEMTNAINNAIAHNITVVAATGNNGNTTSISSPACIENTTAVGATNKDDSIYSNSNRNSITDLVAPGSNVNSTWINGYSVESGTSMAVPHVSAAFALINQYLKEKGKTRTPKQIQDALNNSGKIIYDSGSGLNFSRIDIYSAIFSLDVYGPTITLNSPENNSAIEPNKLINFTITDINNISSAKWTNDTLQYNFSEENETTHIYLINTSGWQHGWFNITVIANDTKDNWENKTYRIGIDYAPIFSDTINNQEIEEDFNLTINISQYFSDLDNDILNYTCNFTSINCENYIICNDDFNGNLTIIPNVNFNGICNISILANDSYRINSSNYFLINITPVTDVFSNFSGTNFSLVNISENFNLTLNNSYGEISIKEINFSDKVQNGIDVNFSYVNISFNFISIDINEFPELNKSAILTLFGLNFNNPRILRNSAVCPSSICEKISYSSGILIFNVSSFSNYSAEDYCGNGYCETENGESCSSCSVDCGVCSGDGGGGSSIIEKKCEENWTCTEWSECENGTEKRICKDINKCGTEEKKPLEEKNCYIPKWNCTLTKCINGIQKEICVDINNCSEKKEMEKKCEMEIKKEKPKKQNRFLILITILLIVILVYAISIIRLKIKRKKKRKERKKKSRKSKKK